jgi:hypothetical protein
MDEDYPKIPLDLLKRLDENFPARHPSIQWSDRKVWLEAGKREVVTHLISIWNNQNPGQPYHV